MVRRTVLQLSLLLPCDDGPLPLRRLWCGLSIFVAAATERERTTWMSIRP
jgi:hypothetical protein